ncbi:hypothetical protein UFOVP602_2 [uncultured Caudovirales phage]|uniref:Uncharacterized protein n=1 Tax=uncultured Caudovirales phage TaxID=2100421 RepID=A0A6J5N4Z4_9CAUD|nr:hypothetical protein UFOVP602_2 [uncultured Caudovirales phage]
MGNSIFANPCGKSDDVGVPVKMRCIFAKLSVVGRFVAEWLKADTVDEVGESALPGPAGGSTPSIAPTTGFLCLGGL